MLVRAACRQEGAKEGWVVAFHVVLQLADDFDREPLLKWRHSVRLRADGVEDIVHDVHCQHPIRIVKALEIVRNSIKRLIYYLNQRLEDVVPAIIDITQIHGLVLNRSPSS